MEQLIAFYRDLKEAQDARLYPDRVQALGMRFNDQWLVHREEIAKKFDVKLDDIYKHKWRIMKELSDEAALS
jgi:hypothetical protein